MTPSEQVLLFMDAPGFQGALARLVHKWDPISIKTWLAGEIGRGTPPHDIAKAIGEVVAAAIMGVVSDMPPSIDRMAFLNADLGILQQTKARIEKRLNAAVSQNGIMLPDSFDNGGN